MAKLGDLKVDFELVFSGKADRSLELVEVLNLMITSGSVKAVRVETSDGEEAWLPRSQLSFRPGERLSEAALWANDIGRTLAVRMPRWLAEQHFESYDELPFKKKADEMKAKRLSSPPPSKPKMKKTVRGSETRLTVSSFDEKAKIHDLPDGVIEITGDISEDCAEELRKAFGSFPSPAQEAAIEREGQYPNPLKPPTDLDEALAAKKKAEAEEAERRLAMRDRERSQPSACEKLPLRPSKKTFEVSVTDEDCLCADTEER